MAGNYFLNFPDLGGDPAFQVDAFEYGVQSPDPGAPPSNELRIDVPVSETQKLLADAAKDISGTITITDQASHGNTSLTYVFKGVIAEGFVGDPPSGDDTVTLSYTSVSEHVACYAEGTRILTAHGEVPIEALAIGDLVVSARTGIAVPVIWLGFRRVDVRHHPRPDEVLPVRVAAGAFAPGIPCRDLRLSPDHAVCVDGLLIPIRRLINGGSILQEDVDSITYWHVELPSHDVILADGLPAESYLDNANRHAFSNGGTVAMLHPDFAAADCRPAPLADTLVEPVWRMLARRADVQVPVGPSGEPQICAIAAGRWLQPRAVRDGRWSYAMPPGATSLRLISPTAAPTETCPWLDDRRRLGVQVAGIVLDEPTGSRALPLDHPDLSQGWWDCEHAPDRVLRWTGGDAIIRLPPSCIRVHLDIRAAVPRARWQHQNASLQRRARLSR